MLVVESFVHFDERGGFVKVFNSDISKKIGFELKESYYSISNRNVIRGMHFQIPPEDHVKIVYVSSGEITDVVLDLRKESPMFGRYLSFNISKEKNIAIIIPRGCAHGFKSHVDNTCVVYMQSTGHSKQCDAGIAYDSFGYDWDIENPILSDRDRTFVKFKNFNSPF